MSVALVGVLLAGACGCGPGAAHEREHRDRTAVQRVLDHQAEAVREGRRASGWSGSGGQGGSGERQGSGGQAGSGRRTASGGGAGSGARSVEVRHAEEAYLSAVDPKAAHYLTVQRQAFRNLLRLPLTQFSYRVTSVRRTSSHASSDASSPGASRGGRGAAHAGVELRYRLRGDDHAAVTSTEQLALTRRAGNWYLAGELPGSARQLWDQGAVTVVRGKHSLVLGVGRKRRGLRVLAGYADRAVSAVGGVWRRRWPGRTVLEVPASLGRMAQLMGSQPATYQGIAAVTTGEAGESTRAPADRIIVNPVSYGQLTKGGQQVVMTHETVHVATRTHTGPGTPLWLSEGLADWTGYRDSSRSPARIAPELARAVHRGDVPRALPSDADFRFGSDPDALGRAYEGGWLACRYIAHAWGEKKLIGFYLRVGSGTKGDSTALDRAFRGQLGVSRAEFTHRWRAYVRAELS